MPAAIPTAANVRRSTACNRCARCCTPLSERLTRLVPATASRGSTFTRMLKSAILLRLLSLLPLEVHHVHLTNHPNEEIGHASFEFVVFAVGYDVPPWNRAE